MKKIPTHFFYKNIEKDGSRIAGTLSDPLKRLAIECRVAITEAIRKGILSCPGRNGDTTSATINKTS